MKSDDIRSELESLSEKESGVDALLSTLEHARAGLLAVESGMYI